MNSPGPSARQSWKIGSLEVVRILENEFPVPPALLRIGDDPGALLERAPWAIPSHATEDGRVRFALASIALVSEGKSVLIDPCISLDVRKHNDEAREAADTHMAALAAAGFAPEDIDLVVCTHIDGIGWTTRPVEEGFEPSFPNARHCWTQTELDRVAAADEAEWESLQPLIRAGLVDPVSGPAELTSHVRAEPCPGHTPGNLTVRIASDGAEAVVVGDHILSPLQLAEPDWGGLDMDPDEAVRQRRALLADCAERDVLVIGPHFASPGAVRVEADGAVWRER